MPAAEAAEWVEAEQLESPVADKLVVVRQSPAEEMCSLTGRELGLLQETELEPAARLRSAQAGADAAEEEPGSLALLDCSELGILVGVSG
ncbi:MAG: hypothetical protein N2489_04390 [Clostridia bacterium]|nr:hypothetical protein [Clostridia bacterium]